MADSIPKLRLSRVSDRCHLIRAPEHESWSWSVDPTKVLVVMLTWLGAKDRHILRYSHLYTKQGLDVLIVKSEAKDFIWPRNSVALAEQIYNVSLFMFFVTQAIASFFFLRELKRYPKQFFSLIFNFLLPNCKTLTVAKCFLCTNLSAIWFSVSKASYVKTELKS